MLWNVDRETRLRLRIDELLDEREQLRSRVRDLIGETQRLEDAMRALTRRHREECRRLSRQVTALKR